MIREVKACELDKLLPAAKEFYSASGIKGDFNAELFQKNWESFLSSKMGAIFALVDDKTDKFYGAIGFIKIPDIITGLLIASEVFWYVMEGRRGEGMKLFNIYEKWAVDQGCKSIRMIHLSNIMPDELKRIYLRRGYREIEIAYEKEI